MKTAPKIVIFHRKFSIIEQIISGITNIFMAVQRVRTSKAHMTKRAINKNPNNLTKQPPPSPSSPPPPPPSRRWTQTISSSSAKTCLTPIYLPPKIICYGIICVKYLNTLPFFEFAIKSRQLFHPFPVFLSGVAFNHTTFLFGKIRFGGTNILCPRDKSKSAPVLLSVFFIYPM